MQKIHVICNCGCKAQLMIQALDNHEVLIDTRINGRYQWVGVFLDAKTSQQLKKLFQAL